MNKSKDKVLKTKNEELNIIKYVKKRNCSDNCPGVIKKDDFYKNSLSNNSSTTNLINIKKDNPTLVKREIRNSLSPFVKKINPEIKLLKYSVFLNNIGRC